MQRFAKMFLSPIDCLITPKREGREVGGFDEQIFLWISGRRIGADTRRRRSEPLLWPERSYKNYSALMLSNFFSRTAGIRIKVGKAYA